MRLKIYYSTLLLLFLVACNASKTDQLLKNKKWRVYDVQVPPNDPYNLTQVTQAKDFKSGYYSNVYYQFLDNNVFIATIDNVPDTGHYELLSNGKIISVTSAKNKSRKSEHLVNIVQLDDDHFDMKVYTGEFHFILRTKPSK
ncbi:hypothetical protein COR50_13505 [Chitinophaga caeni]|uniref:Lipocalin-like domain-containing protein n=1 Tax=Chitinophaga caeni TaxID=2029983 RepID=A0A291QVU4_9BACT|nr:hypothetical protein [Chitinophaga caeni]ATL48098.1 hypothetical protein COR50_13505 [Chitinophaga caeni]